MADNKQFAPNSESFDLFQHNYHRYAHRAYRYHGPKVNSIPGRFDSNIVFAKIYDMEY